MKYYLIAGEPSGDLHGSNLMKELAKTDSSAQFRYFGGDLMKRVGGTLVKHYREMAFMGFVDVLLNIRTIKRNMEFCKKDLLQFNPDVLILVDYPGFNLRIAEFAKQHNIKTYYYISPKIWAWKEHRVKKIKKFVDEMFTIFPFETEFYKKHSFNVHYVGNPLMDSLEEFKNKKQTKEHFLAANNLNDRPILALLAGSRIKEIKRMLPTVLKAAEGFPNFQLVISGVNNIDKNVYYNIIGNKNIPVVFNQTYDLLSFAHTAVVTSGTATLETALFNVPQVVVFKTEGGLLIDFLFRNFFLKTTWVSLPNIVLQKGTILELIQKEFTVKRVNNELKKLLFEKHYRDTIFRDYKQLRALMGEAGCSERTATLMVNMLTQTTTTQNQEQKNV